MQCAKSFKAVCAKRMIKTVRNLCLRLLVSHLVISFERFVRCTALIYSIIFDWRGGGIVFVIEGYDYLLKKKKWGWEEDFVK